MLLLLCLLVGLGPVLSGCATIMSGSEQKIGFSSTPTGAEVTIDGKVLGNTPLTENLSTKETHTVKMLLAGYEPYEMTLTKKTNGWVWGNILFGGLFGGLFGLGIDAITGAIYKLTPEQVNADLKVKGISSTNIVNKTLYITATLSPDKSWEKIGNLKGL